MKRLSLYLFLVLFTLPTLSQADDIRDFQIEGMSIGDSALDFFSKDELEEGKKKGFVYKKKTFYVSNFHGLSFFELYDTVELHIKGTDPKYIIYSITGKINYKNNYKGCVLELEKILPNLKKLFNKSKINDHGELKWKNRNDQEIITKSYFIVLPSGDEIALECYDQPKERIYNVDSLKISIDSKEFVDFLSPS
jgi:hypothetical protein